MLFKDVPSRLATTLRKLAAVYGEESGDGVKIKPALTHDEIAKLIGSTRETTTANLNEFESEGLIEKGRGNIVIKDASGLKARASRN